MIKIRKHTCNQTNPIRLIYIVKAKQIYRYKNCAKFKLHRLSSWILKHNSQHKNYNIYNDTRKNHPWTCRILKHIGYKEQHDTYCQQKTVQHFITNFFILFSHITQHLYFIIKNPKKNFSLGLMERKTRFELATFTLARWRSTTEPLPHMCYFMSLANWQKILYHIKTDL